MSDPVKIGVIEWADFPTVCNERLGYIPAANSILSKSELDTLGFVYASGTKKLISPVYGRIVYLL